MRARIAKLLSLLLAAAVVMSFLVMPASADAGNVVLLKNGVLSARYSNGQGTSLFYKVTPAKEGILEITIDAKMRNADIFVRNSMGQIVKYTEIVCEDYLDAEDHVWLMGFDDYSSRCATIKYEVSADTYTIEVFHSALYPDENTGYTELTAKYPDKPDVVITALTMKLKKGSVIQLGALLSGDGKVTWKSSKKSVVTVSSKGKISCKAKGTAVITAACGKSVYKIKITVT